MQAARLRYKHKWAACRARGNGATVLPASGSPEGGPSDVVVSRLNPTFQQLSAWLVTAVTAQRASFTL